MIFSESVNDFLDTILILASDILKKKRQKEVKKDAQEDFSVVQETSKNVYAKEHVKVVNVTKVEKKIAVTKYALGERKNYHCLCYF